MPSKGVGRSMVQGKRRPRSRSLDGKSPQDLTRIWAFRRRTQNSNIQLHCSFQGGHRFTTVFHDGLQFRIGILPHKGNETLADEHVSIIFKPLDELVAILYELGTVIDGRYKHCATVRQGLVTGTLHFSSRSIRTVLGQSGYRT
jgi:hypothetical protein